MQIQEWMRQQKILSHPTHHYLHLHLENTNKLKKGQITNQSIFWSRLE